MLTYVLEPKLLEGEWWRRRLAWGVLLSAGVYHERHPRAIDLVRFLGLRI